MILLTGEQPNILKKKKKKKRSFASVFAKKSQKKYCYFPGRLQVLVKLCLHSLMYMVSQYKQKYEVTDLKIISKNICFCVFHA